MTSEKIELQISEFESDDIMPLYIEDRGQEGPAYLYFDTRDGEVTLKAKHPAYASTWGQDEHNGHVRRYEIPNNLTVAGYNQLLKDEQVLSLLREIVSHCEEYYSNNNGCYKTRISEEGEAIEDRLQKYLKESDGYYASLEAWDAFQWLEPCSYADLVKEEESHEDAAARLSDEALTTGKWVDPTDIEKAIEHKKRDQEDSDV